MIGAVAVIMRAWKTIVQLTIPHVQSLNTVILVGGGGGLVGLNGSSFNVIGHGASTR